MDFCRIRLVLGQPRRFSSEPMTITDQRIIFPDPRVQVAQQSPHGYALFVPH